MSSGGAQFVFYQFVNASGTPYASCKLFHYASGTTTDKDIWTDEAKTTVAAQPFIGDSRGIVTFYADGDYKFILKDSADNILYTWDNIHITSDTATMWENNHGTAYPTAAATNIWQLFAKHTAGNVLQEIGINNGSSFATLWSADTESRYAVDSGTANAYVVNLSPAPTAYTAGMSIIMKATNANTGASTINVNSLGIKNIKKDSSDALIANDILAGHIISLVYDGTNFQLLSPSGESVYEDATQTLTNKTINTPAQIVSTVASGTAPLSVISTDVNANLNADRVDGLHASQLCQEGTYILYGAGSLAAGAEAETEISLASSDASIIIVGCNGSVNHKASYKAIWERDGQGYIYYDGGYGTLPTDPTTPSGNNKITIRVRNNHSANQTINFIAYGVKA